jgi:hypothetical protein
MRTVIVTRGVVDVVDPSGLREQREVERRSNASGIGGRTFKYSRRAGVGEQIELLTHEAEQLAALGIVKIVT